jgi:hypothetical protein
VGNTQATAGASSEDPAITVCKGKGVGDSCGTDKFCDGNAGVLKCVNIKAQ